MNFKATLYIPGNSIIHTCDARVKLVLLLAYSITLFCISTWTGLGLCLLVCIVCCGIAKVSYRQLGLLLIPLYIILIFTLLFNSFSFDIAQTTSYYGLGTVSAGVFADIEPVALVGTFGFVPLGFARGCYFALRILLLVAASLVVSLTTTSTDLTAALNSFLKPLQKIKVPTADIAMIVSIALRFIPLTADEFMRVYTAQLSRGAALNTGSLWRRLKGFQTIFVPLFVALFRRADNLALAMESRCYGTNPQRTDLNKKAMTNSAFVTIALGVTGCVALAVFL